MLAFLKKTSQGNQLRYQADSSCVVFEELASIMRKTSGLADVLRLALQPVTLSVGVFGGIMDPLTSGKANIEQ